MNNQEGIRVNLNDSTPVQCEKCKGELFAESLVIRKIKGLLVGAPTDQYVPMRYAPFCVSCGHINSEFTKNPNEPDQPEGSSAPDQPKIIVPE